MLIDKVLVLSDRAFDSRIRFNTVLEYDMHFSDSQLQYELGIFGCLESVYSLS